MSDNEIEINSASCLRGTTCPEMSTEQIVEFPAPKSRGRKPKYNTEEERREAKRQQNKRYRTKKHEELIALRRAVNKLNESET